MTSPDAIIIVLYSKAYTVSTYTNTHYTFLKPDLSFIISICVVCNPGIGHGICAQNGDIR